jgi:YD repeat-containing protein
MRRPFLLTDGRATITGMTNPMTKILPALLALAMTTGAASAQQRTFYDAGGKVVGRSSTDSSGTTTNYDARGKVIRRRPATRRRSTMPVVATLASSPQTAKCRAG